MKVWLLFSMLVISPGLFAQSPSVDYTVVVRNPLSHLYAVEMQISGLRSTSVDVALPVWAPGVYAIRDFAGNVQQFEALSRQNQPLQVRLTDKQTWRITKTAAEDVRFREPKVLDGPWLRGHAWCERQGGEDKRTECVLHDA